MSDFRSDRNESRAVQPHRNEVDKCCPGVTNDRPLNARSDVAELIDHVGELIDHVGELIDDDGA
jgi:hypothetical protein